MGTRGQLVFCWRGRRVVIYNHYDSYPSAMGAELFKQLVALLRCFAGDAKRASQHWGELVAALRTTYSCDEVVHPFNRIHAFDDVEAALRSTSPLCICEDEGLDVWIEFVWTVDLDAGALTMASDGGCAEWSFGKLYRGRTFRDAWIAEARLVAYRDDEARLVAEQGAAQPFSAAVAAVQIQASARRFLEVRRGLRPGGVLATLAAARFRRASERRR